MITLLTMLYDMFHINKMEEILKIQFKYYVTNVEENYYHYLELGRKLRAFTMSYLYIPDEGHSRERERSPSPPPPPPPPPEPKYNVVELLTKGHTLRLDSSTVTLTGYNQSFTGCGSLRRQCSCYSTKTDIKSVILILKLNKTSLRNIITH